MGAHVVVVLVAAVVVLATLPAEVAGLVIPVLVVQVVGLVGQAAAEVVDLAIQGLADQVVVVDSVIQGLADQVVVEVDSAQVVGLGVLVQGGLAGLVATLVALALAGVDSAALEAKALD